MLKETVVISAARAVLILNEALKDGRMTSLSFVKKEDGTIRSMTVRKWFKISDCTVAGDANDRRRRKSVAHSGTIRIAESIRKEDGTIGSPRWRSFNVDNLLCFKHNKVLYLVVDNVIDHCGGAVTYESIEVLPAPVKNYIKDTGMLQLFPLKPDVHLSLGSVQKTCI